MSKRSFWSQETTQEDYTQDEEMPAKRAKTAMTPYKKKNYTSQYRKKNYKPKVPRAIATRGTPDGYYEIPVRTLTRVYVNTSTGMWNTDQASGNSIGATGYTNCSFCSQLDNFLMYLGAAQQVTIANPVPGFAELQAIFDEVKIAEEMFDIWVANQTPEAINSAAYIGAPDLFLVEDFNDATPPSGIDAIMQYSKMHRIPFNNGRYTIKYTPKVRVELGSATTESGTTTTLGGVQTAGYCQMTKPAVTHFGLKGSIAIPSGSGSAAVYQLNILRTQIRRYKVNK